MNHETITTVEAGTTAMTLLMRSSLVARIRKIVAIDSNIKQLEANIFDEANLAIKMPKFSRNAFIS